MLYDACEGPAEISKNNAILAPEYTDTLKDGVKLLYIAKNVLKNDPSILAYKTYGCVSYD